MNQMMSNMNQMMGNMMGGMAGMAGANMMSGGLFGQRTIGQNEVCPATNIAKNCMAPSAIKSFDMMQKMLLEDTVPLRTAVGITPDTKRACSCKVLEEPAQITSCVSGAFQTTVCTTCQAYSTLSEVVVITRHV